MNKIILGLLVSVLVLDSLPLRANELGLLPMAPDRVGLTVQQSPVLYFYISHATSFPVRFTLVDPHRWPSIVGEVLLPSPTRPGLWAIRLEDYQMVLKQEVQYRWFVSVNMCPPNPSLCDPPVAGGTIERVDPRLIDYDGRPCDRDSVLLAVKAGVWYDAFACVNELIEANHEDRDLRDLRDQLLRLEKVFPSDELPGRPLGILRDKLLGQYMG